MPQISLIVPVYDAGKYLSKCIDSILNQSFKDFELILVNDGSKDNSLEICNQYSGLDARVIVVNQENGGVSSARNHGLEVAKGDYICFVDADDYVAPEYLEQLYEDAQRDETIDLVFQGRIKKDGSIQVEVSPGIDRIFNLNEDSAFFESLSLFRYCAVYSKLFKREIIWENNIRFLTELNHGEDFDFLAKYLCHCNVVHVSSRMNYYYMINEGSLSSRFSHYDDEHNCLSRLNVSLSKLCRRFQYQALGKQLGEFLGYYTAMVLSSVYEPPRPKRSVRLKNLKNIDESFVQAYSDYFVPPTLNNKIFKFLYVNKCYRLFDLASMMWRKTRENNSRN